MKAIKNETLAKIFAMYLGEKFRFKELDYVNKIVTVGDSYEGLYLILKSLSDITKKDITKLLKTVNDGKASYKIELCSKSPFDAIYQIKDSNFKDTNLWLQIYFDSSDFSLFRGDSFHKSNELHLSKSSVLEAYQNLQVVGYALPYMKYSVDDLVKLNVYKLIKNN